MVSRGLTTTERVLNAAQDELEKAVAPSGFFRRKASTLRSLSTVLQPVFAGQKRVSRSLLLEVSGVGPETADSILLYAFGDPEFVIDAYTSRLLSRLGITGPDARYDDLKSRFENELVCDTNLYREYHALIVQHCKRTCLAKPKCDSCNLARRCCFFGTGMAGSPR